MRSEPTSLPSRWHIPCRNTRFDMGLLTLRGTRRALLLAALAACLAPGGAQAAVLEIVTSGTRTMPASTTAQQITLPTGNDITKSFVICSTRTTNSTPDIYQVGCDLNNGGSGGAGRLTITPGSTAPAASSQFVTYYVAEFSAGVSVQRGTATFSGTSLTPSSAVTLSTAVDCTKSFVLINQRDTDTSNARDEVWTIRAFLATGGSPCTSGTTTSLDLSRDDGRSGTTVTVNWQVVTMEGATVQRGTSCIGGSAATPACPTASGATNGANNRVTLSTGVDTSKSFILVTGKAGSSVAGVEGEYRFRGEFLSTGSSVTGVQFVRTQTVTTSNHQVDIAYEVVSLSDGSTVQTSGTSPSTITGTTASATATLGTAVDTTRTVLFFSNSAGDSGSATRFDDTALTGVVNGSNGTNSTLTFTRGSTTSIGTDSIAWFAVSFARCTTASGTSYDTLCTVGASTTGTTATVNWSSPNTVLIARSTSSISVGPTNGTSPSVGNSLGTGVTVVYNGSTATDTSFPDTGRTVGTQYFYKVWAKGGAAGTCATSPCYVAGVQVSVTPRSSPTAWSSIVAAGGSALNPAVAGTSRVSLPSNNGKLISLDATTGAWDSVPNATVGAVQGYLSVFGSTEMVVGSDQSGWVYSVDPSTGNYNWIKKLGTTSTVADAVQAAVSVYLRQFFSSQMTTAYPGSYDIIFVATFNTLLTNNKVFALRSDTGATLWTFDPANLNTSPCVGGCPMDQVSGQPWVDYLNDRLYLATGPGSGGTQKSFWFLDLRTNGTLVKVYAAGADFTQAPTQSGAGTKLYTGDESGTLHVINLADDVTPYADTTNSAASGTAFKGFVWEDFGTDGRLYFVTTDGNVWCLVPPSTTPCWKIKPVASGTVGQMLISDLYAWVGGSDGKIYQIDLNGATAGTVSKTFTVGAGTLGLGPITTGTGDELYVSTSDGTLYKISLTGGSLP